MLKEREESFGEYRVAQTDQDNKMVYNFLKRSRKKEWHCPWQVDQDNKNLFLCEGESMTEELGRAPLPTEFGDWTYIVFGDYNHGSNHEMLVYGNVDESLGDGEDLLVRMHSSCHTNEIFHAVNCDCRKQLQRAMQLIQQEKRGVILYLDQEGRGNGIVGKMAQLNGMFGWKDGRIQQKIDLQTGEVVDTDKAYKEAGYASEMRDFTVAGEMLKSVGIKSVRLLTNNPKKINGIENAGIKVTPVEIHIAPDNEIIASDLKSKAKNLNHAIREEHWKVLK